MNQEKTFHIMTFGCQMNVNDSEWLRRSLLELGFTEKPFAEARIQILNTCSVREKPENKVYSELGRIRLLAREFPERDVIACVGGCVAQQVGEKLFARSRELRLVFGTDGLAHTPAAIALLAENSSQKISLLDFSGEYSERKHKKSPDGAQPCAFVNIMQGCDNFCTYCIVPFVRGRQKSREAAVILGECRQLIDEGAKEITLLGQNVNSYGQDWQKNDGTRNSDQNFVELLYRVAGLRGLERLRFITPHPKDMPAELIQAFADLPVLAPRLHLPLQSGSDHILKRMGRKYDLPRYLELVEGLRKARPGLTLSTDIIVGFPGESEADFEQTMQAMRLADFAASFSFVYSDRPGAKACGFKDKVPHAEGLKRLGRLQSWQNENTARILQSRLGTPATVLIEGQSVLSQPAESLPLQQSANITEENSENELPASPNSSGLPGLISLHGRDAHGFSVNVNLPPESKLAAGDLVDVIITGAGKHTLKARLDSDIVYTR
ncbi:MAG: tRNA (N6-isopentenyl adenosine(37)-C2)-methylthiotransferase MiaB [Deltaproteobacteria bacterium]|jgi:tRNA-2-methylthio-N6-dimethylallyladenosine synthase|nr:tRNA (N6-isopentenyl adenosine(37)-C2)-methylthiotransferase MiaB [Deltaproteobacteria bacterium]